MNSFFAALFVISIVTLQHVHDFDPLSGDQRQPVIGILAQGTPNNTYPDHGDEIIEAQYAKFLEMAGAKVVAIRGNQPDAYYEELMKKLNGVLFPGGYVTNMSAPYMKAVEKIYHDAIRMNDRGIYFPLWGTCLGFQIMLTVRANAFLLITDSDSENMTIPLDLKPGANESRLFGEAPKEIQDYLTKEPTTYNYHYWSLLTKTFESNDRLTSFFRLISTNKERGGRDYVSTVEAFSYPFYGTQWHPEANVYRWKANNAVNRSPHGVAISQYFANFFVGEARKNRQHFDSVEEESRLIMENDHHEYIPGIMYNEVYYYNYTNEARSHLG